ncbi:MAG: acetyl-CoA carboxylase biotin carboxylase subunit [Ruminococcaceae bacterium]|nr:acetyl-CoA carboxylase biotin carboxylase subunit [Oscillospiraceae bacterium]
MFSKILIANRGEIAVRIIRACKEMGITTVAVFSEADRESLHVSFADESLCIGGASVSDSYLNFDAIITAAHLTDCEAIHPGYGLLSENPRFAELCEENNLTFIGPPPEIINLMGDKQIARDTVKNLGIPIVPGSDVLTDYKEAKAEAKKAGYPILLKACSGGGGKGIRRVNSEKELKDAFTIASEEAKKSFGDDSLYLEKYIVDARHIEIQLMCDNYGTVINLGERDCSIQRRNQKILEESPSPMLSDTVREKMYHTAVTIAEKINYRSLGTVEFVVDRDNNFYFIEMNTRLQVEHPITEMTTGVDLVKWQIRIAAGTALDFTNDDVTFLGHAIECRINAEDPDNNFLPTSGKVKILHIPGGPMVRFDTALYQEYSIPPFYDSLLGKLIVHAKSRSDAIRKMRAALCELIVEGVVTNRDTHLEILSNPSFVEGKYNTSFLSKML